MPVAALSVLLFLATPGVALGDQTNGTAGDDGVQVETSKSRGERAHDLDDSGSTSDARTSPPRYNYIWDSVSEFDECAPGLGAGTAWSCTPHADSCEAGNGSGFVGEGDVLQIGDSTSNPEPSEGVTQRGTRVDTEGDEAPVDLGVRCAMPGDPESGGAGEAPPVVIVVTQSDFARLPVKPLQATAGPAGGWLPVNMPNVLYTEPDTQELSTELLDTPVAIRATPVSYYWDLGDGNTITTSTPGEPYPSELISGTYVHEGWYDVTLTTTFAGQYSVEGGEWQDIDGTIEVASDPVPIYSKSLESRLVNGDVPVDEDEDPWVPERSPETEGAPDPNATHRSE